MSIGSILNRFFCHRPPSEDISNVESVRLLGDYIGKMTKLLVKQMASDKEEILSSIQAIGNDIDVIQVNVDALEELVKSGQDSSQAFVAIREALAAVKTKSGATASDSSSRDDDATPPVEPPVS